MTPLRLRECLEIIRWPVSTLAAVLEVDSSVAEQWAGGAAPIPVGVASWVEALCFTHEASDLMRPVIDNGKRSIPSSKTRKREHIPVYSYNLLRMLGRGPVALQALFGTDDEGAVFFLVSRGLATREDGNLTITDEGRAVGRLADG